MSWINDSLEKKFGIERTEQALIGEYRFDGPKRLVEIKFNYTNLPAVADNSVVIDDRCTLPKGAWIEAVEIQCQTDIDSASDDITLNVGTIDTDRTSNAAVDSLVVAATQTEMNTGGTNIAGWVGTLVGGTPLTAPKILTWEVDNHAASAGAGVIRIYYSVP